MSSRKVVYRDQTYADGTWVLPAASNQIANQLETKGFRRLSATQLSDWMKTTIAENTSKGTVVVFSQDTAPVTVVDFRSKACLLRKYLEQGGNIVWLGDVPFYWLGHSKTNTVDFNMKLRERGFREEWGISGCYNILGVPPAILDFDAPTHDNKMWRGPKLKCRRYSKRPVRQKKLWLDKKNVMMWADLPPEVSAADILPQRITSEPIPRSLKLIDLLGSIVKSIIGIVSSIVVASLLYLGLVPTQDHLVALIASLLSALWVLHIAWLLGKKRPRFASAWFKQIGKRGGKFIRLLDTDGIQEAETMMIEDIDKLSRWAIGRGKESDLK